MSHEEDVAELADCERVMQDFLATTTASIPDPVLVAMGSACGLAHRFLTERDEARALAAGAPQLLREACACRDALASREAEVERLKKSLDDVAKYAQCKAEESRVSAARRDPYSRAGDEGKAEAFEQVVDFLEDAEREARGGA